MIGKTVNSDISSSLTPLHYFTTLDFIFLTIAFQIYLKTDTTILDMELSKIKQKKIAKWLSFWCNNMKLKQTDYKNRPKNTTLV
jgi:hypothetical protein